MPTYVVIRESTLQGRRLGMEHGEFAPDAVFGPFATRKEAVQFRARERQNPGAVEYWIMRCTSVPTS